MVCIGREVAEMMNGISIRRDRSMLTRVAHRKVALRLVLTCLGSGLFSGAMPVTSWARAVLEVTMTMGLSVSPDYYYVVALSSDSRSGPRANLTDPDVTLTGDEPAFVSEWDYLIRVKPLNDESVLQATIQEEGQPEADFLIGFNEVRLSETTRPRDTINIQVDLQDLTRLNPEENDIHVGLLTIESPFLLDPEETSLALDAVTGDFPNYFPLSLSDIRRAQVTDPQQQETLRRSRQMIGDQEVSVVESIEASSLGILAANILTFDLELVDR